MVHEENHATVQMPQMRWFLANFDSQSEQGNNAFRIGIDFPDQQSEGKS